MASNNCMFNKQEIESGSLMEELEGDDLFDLGPLPSNLLDPPMWSHDPHASASCGSWQKPYTHMHRGTDSLK